MSITIRTIILKREAINHFENNFHDKCKTVLLRETVP